MDPLGSLQVTPLPEVRGKEGEWIGEKGVGELVESGRKERRWKHGTRAL